MNKDLESSFDAGVAGPSSNPDATEKEVSQTDIVIFGHCKIKLRLGIKIYYGPENMESKTNQDSFGFKGMCMKNILQYKYFTSSHFHTHLSAVDAYGQHVCMLR